MENTNRLTHSRLWLRIYTLLFLLLDLGILIYGCITINFGVIWFIGGILFATLLQYIYELGKSLYLHFDQ